MEPAHKDAWLSRAVEAWETHGLVMDTAGVAAPACAPLSHDVDMSSDVDWGMHVGTVEEQSRRRDADPLATSFDWLAAGEQAGEPKRQRVSAGYYQGAASNNAKRPAQQLQCTIDENKRARLMPLSTQ